MYERLDGYVRRIRVSAAFIEEIGALLGINPLSTLAPVGGAVPPKLDPSPQPGSQINIKFAKGASTVFFSR